MAVTKIIKIKKNTKACIKYIENAKKTTDGLLTTYSGCTKENAYLYFQLSLDSKNRHRDSDKEVKALSAGEKRLDKAKLKISSMKEYQMPQQYGQVILE